MPYGLRGADNATLEIFAGKMRVKDGGLDASKLANAATQTLATSGFTIEHNNKAVVLISLIGVVSTRTSSTTMAIADGIREGQELCLYLEYTDIICTIVIKDNANTYLRGDWKRDYAGAWLTLVWRNNTWREVDRDYGNDDCNAPATQAYAEGSSCTASGYSAHAEGAATTAAGSYAHAEGFNTQASGEAAHAEGKNNLAQGDNSHAEGYETDAIGARAHAEGDHTYASGAYSHAEGYYSQAVGPASHTEGYSAVGSGGYNHAEGYNTDATIEGAHAEGRETLASGASSHAEGYQTQASGIYSHAEGKNCQATGERSHAEGNYSIASAKAAHAEGGGCEAAGENSHASGGSSYANQLNQYAHGGGQWVVDGDAQFSRFVLREEVFHGDSNWYTIGMNDTGIGPVLPTDGAWIFEAQVIGVSQDCAKLLSYLVNGSIRRIGNATSLLASSVTTVHETDAGFECQVAADDVNEALSIQVRDATVSSDTIRWVATVKLTQVVYT